MAKVLMCRILNPVVKLLPSSTQFHGKVILQQANIPVIVQRLCSSEVQEVCNGVNIFKDGQDPPIKQDSEYPDWLWKISTEIIPIEQLSTNDVGYWRRMRKAKIKQQNALRKQGKLK